MARSREEINEYKRNYYATHEEARKRRDAYTKEWREKHKEEWNAYFREYQRARRLRIAKEKLREDGIEV